MLDVTVLPAGAIGLEPPDGFLEVELPVGFGVELLEGFEVELLDGFLFVVVLLLFDKVKLMSLPPVHSVIKFRILLP